MYKYETHCHCSKASACGRSTPQELIQAYHDTGYSGLVLTDHFFFGNTAVDRTLPWSEFVKVYYDAYLSAKPFAKSLDFDLLFGLEHAYGSGKELLIYGIDLEFLLDNPDIPKISVDELVKRVHDYGGIVVQAHPYRDRGYIDMSVGPRTDIVDGVEIFNACNEPKDNKLAFDKLGKKDFIYTCGGDVHSHTQTDKFSGIALPYRVRNEKEFVKALKNKDHSYIINDKIVDEIDEEILLGEKDENNKEYLLTKRNKKINNAITEVKKTSFLVADKYEKILKGKCSRSVLNELKSISTFVKEQKPDFENEVPEVFLERIRKELKQRYEYLSQESIEAYVDQLIFEWSISNDQYEVLLHFYFDFGGSGLWAKNRVAQEIYGRSVSVNKLPISNALKNEINKLQKEFDSSFNQDDVSVNSKWTVKQKSDFYIRAEQTFSRLKEETRDKLTVSFAAESFELCEHLKPYYIKEIQAGNEIYYVSGNFNGRARGGIHPNSIRDGSNLSVCFYKSIQQSLEKDESIAVEEHTSTYGHKEKIVSCNKCKMHLRFPFDESFNFDSNLHCDVDEDIIATADTVYFKNKKQYFSRAPKILM